MSLEDAQHAINKAVKIATRAAMYGHPVAVIRWIPSLSASDDIGGVFVVYDELPLTPSMTPSWDR